MRDRSQWKEVQIELVHSYMRHVPYEGRFDTDINLFSSFGYRGESGAKALKPGG